MSRTRSVRARRDASGISPCTSTLITLRLRDDRLTTGFSASSGKVMIRSTSFRMSWSALLLSAPLASSAVTVPTPSRAWEVSFLTPSTPPI